MGVTPLIQYAGLTRPRRSVGAHRLAKRCIGASAGGANASGLMAVQRAASQRQSREPSRRRRGIHGHYEERWSDPEAGLHPQGR